MKFEDDTSKEQFNKAKKIIDDGTLLAYNDLLELFGKQDDDLKVKISFVKDIIKQRIEAFEEMKQKVEENKRLD